MKGNWMLRRDGKIIYEGSFEACLIIASYEGCSNMNFNWHDNVITARD